MAVCLQGQLSLGTWSEPALADPHGTRLQSYKHGLRSRHLGGPTASKRQVNSKHPTKHNSLLVQNPNYFLQDQASKPSLYGRNLLKQNPTEKCTGVFKHGGLDTHLLGKSHTPILNRNIGAENATQRQEALGGIRVQSQHQ